MTRQEIIEAALDLACEKGLGRISIQQIADRVNLKKSSIYSHFKSKEEIIEEMYVYIREKAKQQTGNTNVDYGKYVEGRSLHEILTGVVTSYRSMGAASEMNKFFNMIMAERAYDPIASQIMVEETRKMITAAKNLFYAISVKGIAHFDNPDGAALTFAMSVHSILDHETDSMHAGSDDADGEMELFISEFCRVYGKEGYIK